MDTPGSPLNLILASQNQCGSDPVTSWLPTRTFPILCPQGTPGGVEGPALVTSPELGTRCNTKQVLGNPPLNPCHLEMSFPSIVLLRMSLLWEGLPSFSQNLLCCSLAVPLTAPPPPHTASPSGTHCAINTSMEEPFKEPFEERSQRD